MHIQRFNIYVLLFSNYYSNLGQTRDGDLLGEMNPLYAIIAGCFVVLIVFLILAIIAMWKRSRRRKPPVAKTHKRNGENSKTFLNGDAIITRIGQDNLEDIGNPDVVPNKSGKILTELIMLDVCSCSSMSMLLTN